MNTETNALSALDLETASLEQLEQLSISDLLGGDVTSYDINNNLPDCVVGVVIVKSELKHYAAIPEEDKKARIVLNVQLKVLHAFSCDDRDIDPESLVGRVHFESYPLTSEFGVSRAIKLILGATGISFTDKKAWASLDGAFDQVLQQLIESQVQFGVTIKNTSRNGFENCDVVDKPKAFIPMGKYAEMVG